MNDDKRQLNIHDEFLILGNNPELAEIFAREDMQELLKRILSDIENHNFKKFLKEGNEKFYEDIISQLKNSYEILSSKKEDKDSLLVTDVKRCFDGKIFKIGDDVMDGDRCIKIGRMYIDLPPKDDDLKIRLDVDGKGTITWRKISQIEKKEDAK